MRRATHGLILTLGTSFVPARLEAQASVPLGTRVSVSERFELHSDPWINLHHFLYQWAREERGLGTGRQQVVVPERASAPQLSGQERRAWESAVRFYRDSIASRSHFDDRMLEQKAQLLELRGDPTATPPDAIPGIRSALVAAMPVYRARWWQQHDESNHRWIASVTPTLGRHERRYVELIRRLYGAEWPSTPVRVDVSAYANARAGYTEARHVVIFSTDRGNQDLWALETLLHEVQHTRDIGMPLRERLTNAFSAARVQEPENLWHGLIFATAGAFLQSVAEQESLPTHQPYWIREGFDRLRGWSEVVAATTDHWVPFVRGTGTRDAALAALVSQFQTR